MLFYKDTFSILQYSQQPVFDATMEKEDGYNICLHWRDGIQWEIEMNIAKKNIEVIIVTAKLVSEKTLFDKLKAVYPSAYEISTFYKTECWIKNTNYTLNRCKNICES